MGNVSEYVALFYDYFLDWMVVNENLFIFICWCDFGCVVCFVKIKVMYFNKLLYFYVSGKTVFNI